MPAVLEAPIAFELKLDRIIPVGEDHLILGTVEHVQLDQAVNAGDYRIDINKWHPLASLAGDFLVLHLHFQSAHNLDGIIIREIDEYAATV